MKIHKHFGMKNIDVEEFWYENHTVDVEELGIKNTDVEEFWYEKHRC